MNAFVVILFLAVIIGTVLFHILSPWWFTPLASNWSGIDMQFSLHFGLLGLCSWLLVCF